MLQNLIWVDDSILGGHALRMLSAVPIQVRAQPAFLPPPDVSLLAYTRLRRRGILARLVPLPRSSIPDCYPGRR